MVWLLDPNKLLPLLVGFWGVLGLAQAARRIGDPRQHRSALDVGMAALTALGLTIGGYVLLPSGAGWIAIGSWCVLVIAPNALGRTVTHRAGRRDFRTAETICRVLAWVRPLAHWRELASLIRALRWLSEGQRSAGLGLLAHLERANGALAGEARLERLSAEQRWEELYGSVDSQRQSGTVPLAWVPRLLRAMGETARTDELLHAMLLQAGPLFSAPGLIPHALLVTFAFAGRPDLVRRLLETSLRHLDTTSQQAWLATAELAGTEPERGRARLERCRTTADAAQLLAIERRLASPPPTATEVLSPTAQRQVEALFDHWQQVQRFVPGFGSGTLPWATILITGAIVVVFGLEEALGGSMNPAILELVGALIVERVIAGEWWRVFTAVFIHMGPLHLVMNGVALVALGTFVERRLGGLRLAALFLVSGTLPMATHVLLAALAESAPSVGASGGVMGLAGAAAALLAQGYYEHGVTEARRPLRLIATLVILQTGIDLTVPIVDFLGHSMGLATGFTLGALFCGLRGWRVVLVSAPAYAFALGMQLTLADLPWRTAPCEDETAMCEQLCDMEFYDACHALGVKYLSGDSVEEDPTRARRFLTSACEGQLGRSCAVLGNLVYYGEGGPASQTEGRALAWRGCQLHSKAACKLLDHLCVEEHDTTACDYRDQR